MNLSKKIALLTAITAVCMASPAFAEEAPSSEEAPVVPSAVWIDPIQSTPATWFDTTPGAIALPERELIDAGAGYVIMRLGASFHVMNAELQNAQELALPENIRWIGIDEKARILAFDGSKLYFAETPQKAAEADGFISALTLEGVSKIDHVGATVIYADQKSLTFADLDQMKTSSVALSDFFNETKVAAMTPEAVAAAEAAAAKKKSSKTSKTTKKAADAEEPSNALAAIEVQSIAARHDGVVVVRLRQMLATRVFVTKDNGRSWTEMKDAPSTIVHNLGWIWDGKSRVLADDGLTWLDVCGPQIDVFSRFEPTQVPQKVESAFAITSAWPASPAVPAAQPSEESDATTEETKPAQNACASVEAVPVMVSKGFSDAKLAKTYLAPRDTERTGDRYYFTADGPVEDGRVRLWKSVAGSDSAEINALPAGCDPVFVDSAHGLGVLLCRQGDNDSQLYVYTRAATTGWFAEATVPAVIGVHTQMHMADDGTLVLNGDCEQIDATATETDLSEDGSFISDEAPASSVNLCTAAVRSNVEVGEPEAWRVDRVNDVEVFQPVGDGRVLALVNNGDNRHSIIESARYASRMLVSSFDSSAYDGVELTSEGCLALYDASNATDASRILTADGKLSAVSCEASREIELARQQSEMEEIEYVAGENRYGLRVGAGAFFASGVQTWAMRVEGLFPIYGGRYEVGAIFRMAGGNVSSAMGYLGLVTARWRYDDFENFDFAVGAGIGYGQLTGYSKKTKINEKEEEIETDESKSYKKTNTASLRYLISAIATYKFADNWKLYINAELLGGSSWGADIGGGLEIRF